MYDEKEELRAVKENVDVQKVEMKKIFLMNELRNKQMSKVIIDVMKRERKYKVAMAFLKVQK